MSRVVLQEEWGWGVVVSVLKKPPKPAVNGAAAAAADDANAAAADDAIDTKAVAANAAACYIVDTLLPCKPGSAQAGMIRPAPVGLGAPAGGDAAAAEGNAEGGDAAAAAAGAADAELTVVPVLLPLVTALSSLRVTLPDDIRPAEVRQSLLCVLKVRWALADCAGSILVQRHGLGEPSKHLISCVTVHGLAWF